MDYEKLDSFSTKDDIARSNYIFNWNKGKLDSCSTIDDIMRSNDIFNSNKGKLSKLKLQNDGIQLLSGSYCIYLARGYNIKIFVICEDKKMKGMWNFDHQL